MAGDASTATAMCQKQPFYQTLSQLGDQYEQEVTHLHNKIDSLRAVLKKESLSDPTIWEEDLPWNLATDGSPACVEASDRLPAAPAKANVAVVLDMESASEVAKGAMPQQPQEKRAAHDPDPAGEAEPEVVFASLFGLRGQWKKAPKASESIVSDPDKQLVSSYARAMMDTIHPQDETERKNSSLLNDNDLLHGTLHGFLHCTFLPRCKLINPGQPSRVVWDLSGMFLISYDMISIPVHLAFAPPEHWISTMMGWTTLCFWTLDMFASVFTGYFQNGKLVMDQQAIVLNYLKGWFWVDCVVVLPDWVMKGMGSVTNVAGLGRILRIARVMRVLRLLRLLKLKKVFALVYDWIDSESMFIVVNLMQLITVILVMNHIIACLWYLLGRVHSEGGHRPNWIQDQGIVPVIDQSLEWKYLTSLHWSITQFTPASMDVSATNPGERLFSIVILFWALVALSSIIGSVSASMTALRNLSSDENKSFWVLRRYLRQNDISRNLTQRVIKYLEFQNLSKHNAVAQGSVVLLGNLSEQFKIELAHQLHAPVTLEHPFFKFLEGHMNQTMFRICHGALQSHAFAVDEVAFNPGDEGLRMYFIKAGMFDYKMVDEERIDIDLGPKFWAAEASLWTEWRHRGTLTARQPSEVMATMPTKFSDIFMLHPRPWYLARNYAVEFVAYLNKVGVNAQTDMIFDSDLWREMVKASDTYQLTRSARSMSSTSMQPGELPEVPTDVRVDLDVGLDPNRKSI